MTMLSGRRQRQNEDPTPSERDGSLPLRWALIIAVSVGGGLAVGCAVSLVPGVTVGIALAGLLHRVLAKA